MLCYGLLVVKDLNSTRRWSFDLASHSSHIVTNRTWWFDTIRQYGAIIASTMRWDCLIPSPKSKTQCHAHHFDWWWSACHMCSTWIQFCWACCGSYTLQFEANGYYLIHLIVPQTSGCRSHWEGWRGGAQRKRGRRTDIVNNEEQRKVAMVEFTEMMNSSKFSFFRRLTANRKSDWRFKSTKMKVLWSRSW